MYTGFCILSFLWKQIEDNIDVHVYWVLYSRYFLGTERRKHICKGIMGSVFSVFSEKERRKHRCTCILGSVFSAFSRNRKKKT
jgi:uncharacterized membrane protein